MPEYRALTWYQRNPDTSRITILDEATREAFDLAAVTEVQLVVKATRETDDADAIATLSTSTGEIAIIDPGAGVCEVTVPASVTADAGVVWYRLDAINPAGPITCSFGALTIVDT